MGNNAQLEFIKLYQASLQPPYLEVGARDYGTTPDIRSLFEGDYTGTDLTWGVGVDVKLDLTLPFEKVYEKLYKHYKTIFCMSVLEHCSEPFTVADNLYQLLEPKGKIVISVPFAWQKHGYPNDYWRFTEEGVKKLFPEIDFLVTHVQQFKRNYLKGGLLRPTEIMMLGRKI